MATYRDFLNKSWGAGSASNAARAAAWRRTQAPATPAPAAAAPVTPPPASYTPGALDQSGALNKGNLDYNYQIGQRAANQNYVDEMAQIDAQRPQLGQQRDDGLNNADNQAGGRGFGRSGVRLLNRTRVGEAYDEGIRNLSSQAVRAANKKQQTMDQLEGTYRTDSTNNLIDSNVRQKTAFDEANPVAPVVAATAPKPKVSYKAWLNGRTSTPTTAAAWRKAQGI